MRWLATFGKKNAWQPVLVCAIIFTLPLVSSAATNDRYIIAGTDRLRVGVEQVCVDYEGEGRLSLNSGDDGQTLTAATDYWRRDATGTHIVHASFVQETAPSFGDEFLDANGRDPDYMTILSQPLAIELGSSELQALAQLSKRVRLEFPSRIGDGNLSGFLEHIRSRSVNSLIGLRFVARGPMRAPVPKRPAATMVGIVTLAGAGYYSSENGRLVAIYTTMTFDGSFRNRGHAIPVHVTYERQIETAMSAVVYNTRGRACH